MNAATVLVVVLSAGGYWFGGTQQTVELQWSAPGAPAQRPEAVLHWQLQVGRLVLATGRQEMPRDDQALRVTIDVPAVRWRTEATWSYRLVAAGDQQVLATGEQRVFLFPRDLMADLPRRVGERRIVVWDAEGQLAGALATAQVPHRRIEDWGALQVAPADVILVAADQLDERALADGVLQRRAAGGASVMLFAQPRAARLGGHDLAGRTAPRRLEWRADHALFDRFLERDLRNWLEPATAVRAVQIAEDAEALELVYWPTEAQIGEAEKPLGPIDALLLTQTTGSGRMVICQLPLGSFSDDPRALMFLRNSIDYLLTRPQPTPSPSQRERERRRRDREDKPQDELTQHGTFWR